MHRLPPDFDASVFVGSTLETICFSANTVNLTFDRDLQITILGTFMYRAGPNAEPVEAVVPVATSNLMSLAGKVVESAEAHVDSALTIRFAGQHILTLANEPGPYESYTLQIKGREIFV